MQRGLDDEVFRCWDDKKSISENVRDYNYKKLNEDVEHLSHQQQLVYNALCDNPQGLCDRGIQKYIWNEYGIKISISSINGRRNELVDYNLVKADGRTPSPPDYNNQIRLVTNWKIADGQSHIV